MRRLAHLLLCSVAGWTATASETAPLVESSLHTSNRTYCLEFHHSNLSPACRREAAEVNQIILIEMMERDCTILLSRPFVTEELEYYRRFRTNELSAATCDKLIAVLGDALTSGEIDWDRLRQIHTEAANGEVVSRSLPWLYPWRTVAAPKLATESNQKPLLRYVFEWQGIEAKGVASVYYQAFIGRTTLWKADARVAFHGSRGEIGRHYPAPAWVQEYFGQQTKPIPILMAQVIEDLRRGLKAPPSPAQESSRTKAPKKKRS
jgi:hypothetical protein